MRSSITSRNSPTHHPLGTLPILAASFSQRFIGDLSKVKTTLDLHVPVSPAGLRPKTPRIPKSSKRTKSHLTPTCDVANVQKFIGTQTHIPPPPHPPTPTPAPPPPPSYTPNDAHREVNRVVPESEQLPHTHLCCWRR